MTVPAVTEVSRRQALHCKVRTLRPSRQHSSCPHSGQAKPDPQRRSSNHSAQDASSGNRRSNSGSDVGKSATASLLQTFPQDWIACRDQRDKPFSDLRSELLSAIQEAHDIADSLGSLGSEVKDLIKAVEEKVDGSQLDL